MQVNQTSMVTYSLGERAHSFTLNDSDSDSDNDIDNKITQGMKD